MPLYSDAIANRNSLKVVQALIECGGVANFSDIGRNSRVQDSLLVYHLDRLQRLNVVEQEAKGTYRLTFKTPLCYVLGRATKVPVAYFGLLGKRENRSRPETAVALELLKKEGVTPKLVYVVTSPEALNEWKESRLPYQWILCYEDEIASIDSIQSKVRQQLENLLREFLVVMDCTSATKPATIAYYDLARKYCVPLIYVYEENNQLKWLISRETIKKELGMML